MTQPTDTEPPKRNEVLSVIVSHHHYARRVTGDGRILYICTDPGCGHTVDWLAAREEFDRQDKAWSQPTDHQKGA